MGKAAKNRTDIIAPDKLTILGSIRPFDEIDVIFVQHGIYFVLDWRGFAVDDL
jgi:hypothetical protein